MRIEDAPRCRHACSGGGPRQARLGGPTAENRAGDEDPPATLARSACGHGIAARERRPEKWRPVANKVTALCRFALFLSSPFPNRR
jgi:hypothetical protein